MRQACLRRDESYDGVFLLGVRSTGIFCRPSCPARKPKPENVQYFSTTRAALFAGYRPCKRCRPLDTNGRPPAWVGKLLAAVDTEPAARIRDRDLRGRGVDPARARRYFLKNYGMTFQAYCRARRLGKAFTQIRNGGNMSQVALGTGYESISGFRDAFAETFGRSPGRSRSSDCIVVAWLESPLGPLVAGATNDGVCLLEFTDRRMLETQFATLRKRFACAIVPGENEHLERLRDELVGYFAGTQQRFSVPLVYPGTPFERRVWDELLRIPYGETQSYDGLARAIGCAGGSRAVGGANGRNRIAIVIPCHRVVNKSGELGGYGGGLWRKRFLLDLEQSIRGQR
jgi:AraC family transcriptional regulator of adaptative response/methylated-DNA-[protein]-cysteine methyltransferase